MSADGGRRRRRKLSDDERALWKGVTRSIAPLRKRQRPPAEPDDMVASAVAVAPAAAVKSNKPKPQFRPIAAVAPPAPKPPSPPQPAPLDRRSRKRIARGIDQIDARLDLHGRTQAEAHVALLGFLRGAQARGARTALVVTGKGSADPYGERGVLKRQVPMWLRLPEFRALVVGFDQAAFGHGGEGALYVRLRRMRE